MRRKGLYERYVKRPQDLVLSVLALALLSPLLLLIALCVRVRLGRPVLFVQPRPGLHGALFRLYKFRTMTDGTDETGALLPDADRLTRFGMFLRSWSLDELPELWNIVRGEMSVVGPRPLLAEYLALYNDRQRQRHAVRPGLSGHAQVNGRNALGWEDRLHLDALYAEHITFLGDWKIIFLTLKKVLLRQGITSGTSATMEPFTGTSPESGKP